MLTQHYNNSSIFLRRQALNAGNTLNISCNIKPFSPYAFDNALSLALTGVEVSHKDFKQHEAGLPLVVSLPFSISDQHDRVYAVKVVNQKKTLPGQVGYHEMREVEPRREVTL